MSDVLIALGAAGARLEAFGRALVERFAQLNVSTALLVFGALLLDRALARRTRASWRIALYAPVALRVLLPLDWRVPLVSAPRVAEWLAPLARIGGDAEGSAARGASGAAWCAIAAAAYVAVVALLAARAIAARVRLDRALEGAPPAPAGAAPCPVVMHDHLGPMAVGVIAPRIVLPRRLFARGEETVLACVLRHEAAHVRRGDGWLSAAMQSLAIVAWPVAPVWIAMARVRHLVELACDEAALSGADATERRLYGHALLDVAESRSLAVAPIGTGALHFGSTLRARIEALASQRRWPAAVQGIALSAALAVLFAACSSAAPRSASTTAAESTSDAYGYEFADDPASAPRASTTSDAAERNADGRLAPEVIQASVRAHFDALRACYEAGLKKDPALRGTVSVKYTIAADGTTRDAADSRSTMPDKEVVACVVDEVRTITYPRPEGGVVTVVYPVQFSP